MTPSEQAALVMQLVHSLDEPLRDYRSPAWQPPLGMNEAVSTLWAALRAGELDGLDRRSEELVVRIYSHFDDLYDSGIARMRRGIHDDLRKDALALRRHLERWGQGRYRRC